MYALANQITLYPHVHTDICLEGSAIEPAVVVMAVLKPSWFNQHHFVAHIAIDIASYIFKFLSFKFILCGFIKICKYLDRIV